MLPLVKKILLVMAALLLAFVLMLYVALRTKITDVTDKPPYAQFIGQPLVLKRPASISKSYEPNVQANPYLLQDAQVQADQDAGPQYALPAGSVITLQQAKLFKNGTSGFERSYVLGTAFVPELNAKVAFEYAWGKNNVSFTGNEKDHYTFPLALWQDRVIDGKFNY